MKNLITSFLLLASLVSVQATNYTPANADFSTGGLLSLGSAPWNSPFISGINSITVTATNSASIDASTSGVISGELVLNCTANATPVQGDINVKLNDITLTSPSAKSSYILTVQMKVPAGSITPNLYTRIYNGATDITNASYTLTKPNPTWSSNVYSTVQVKVTPVSGNVTVPTKLSCTFQCGKMFPSTTSLSTLTIDNITFAECSAAVSGLTSANLAPYQEGSGPSAEQSFTASGSDLLSNLRVVAGSNMEISKTSGSGFVADSLILTQTAGTVAPTTIYTRLKAGVVNGTYTDATTQVTVTSTSPLNTITPQVVQFTGSVSPATGLSQLTGAKLTTSNGTISIEGLGAGELVDVYDSMGKKVKSAIADGGNLKIAINAKGVYVVKIKSFSQKVVL